MSVFYLGLGGFIVHNWTENIDPSGYLILFSQGISSKILSIYNLGVGDGADMSFIHLKISHPEFSFLCISLAFGLAFFL